MDDSIRQLFVYSDCQKLQFDEPTAGQKDLQEARQDKVSNS